MNATTHHLTSTYLVAYTEELAADMRSATLTRRGRGIRRSIARSMVALGTRMSPEEATVIDGRLVLLEPTKPRQDLQRAA